MGDHAALTLISELVTLHYRPPSLPPKPKKRRLGQGSRAPEAKLFGGSIEEYVEATSEEIPLLVRSCVRVISMYGKCLHDE